MVGSLFVVSISGCIMAGRPFTGVKVELPWNYRTEPGKQAAGQIASLRTISACNYPENCQVRVSRCSTNPAALHASFCATIGL
jgi:hypothetical protein